MWLNLCIGSVPAGYPSPLTEQAKELVDINGYLIHNEIATYIFRVKGNAMTDAGIFDGDYLAVKKTSEVRNGDIVVARLDDEVTVKRWQQRKTAQGIVIELQAENPDFKNIFVDARQPNFAIEGQAVGLIRAQGL